MARELSGARGSDEARRGPWHRRVVDAHAVECAERLSEIGDARLVDRANVPLRSAMPTTLGALKHAQDVLGDRARRDEAQMRREAVLLRERRLLDRRRRSERGLDRKASRRSM